MDCRNPASDARNPEKPSPPSRGDWREAADRFGKAEIGARTSAESRQSPNTEKLGSGIRRRNPASDARSPEKPSPPSRGDWREAADRFGKAEIGARTSAESRQSSNTEKLVSGIRRRNPAHEDRSSAPHSPKPQTRFGQRDEALHGPGDKGRALGLRTSISYQEVCVG
jgi:hypothetical protein